MSNDLVVDFCDHKAAKYAVMHWHYSKSMPMPPLFKIGVWENRLFIGTVIFSRGASPNLGAGYGLKSTEVCELTRVALTSHLSYTSQIVSRAMKLMRSSNNIRLIVSFADTREGHHGGIYQAMNWVYTGKSNPKYEYKDKRGRIWHSRQVTTSGKARQFGQVTSVPKRADCERIRLNGKHRYLYPLDKAMRRQIMPLSKPYPKKL